MARIPLDTPFVFRLPLAERQRLERLLVVRILAGWLLLGCITALAL